MTLSPSSIQAEFSATLVDEWVRSGVRHAVIAPGSRSSAVAVALLSDPRVEASMRLDERSAAFFALGIALATGTPVIMLTTSGTAAAEVHAAVVESDLAEVPLIVITADRPIELHGVHAPQTIDQSALFGRSLRYFADLPVPSEETRSHWRSFAARLVVEATQGARGAGPVQANIAFREPIVGSVGSIPAGRQDGAPWHAVIREDGVATELSARVRSIFESVSRAVVIAGGGECDGAEALLDYAQRRGWPVLGDARAIRREEHRALINHADQILRSREVVDALRPELIVHVGMPHASKTLMGWNAHWSDMGVTHVFVDPHGSFADPERLGATFIAVRPGRLFRALADTSSNAHEVDPLWLERWRRCDDAVERAIGRTLDAGQLSEPSVARALFRALERRDTLFCSSSMPIRDVEWFCAPQTDAPRVLANRGANGIDGVVSTVLGVARVSAGRTVGLIGDLAFLHDLSGLVWGSAEAIPRATFVVIDNNGGGIFSFLDYPSVIDENTFERGFGTPQRTAISEVAGAFGCDVELAYSRSDLESSLARSASRPGISVVIVATDREANVAVHAELARASIEAARAVI